MVGWHHRPNEYEFEQTLGDGEGQRRLACCSSWGIKESDTTLVPEQQQGGDLGIHIYSRFPQAPQLRTTGLNHLFGREPTLPCMITVSFMRPI